MGEDEGGKGERDFRNNHKGHMDKNKGGGNRGGRWGWLGRWGGVGERAENCTGTTIKFKSI